MQDNQALTLGTTCLVCKEAGASPFDDDLEDCCADCGRMLTFRPYLAEETPKICQGCFMVRKDAAAQVRASS